MECLCVPHSSGLRFILGLCPFHSKWASKVSTPTPSGQVCSSVPHPYLQPPSPREWNPGLQWSHFQPVTEGLQVQAPEWSHWRLREPGEEEHRAVEVGEGGERGGGKGGARLLTCWVAVTGLAWCHGGPSVIVPLTALTVWPGCVVTAVMTVPAVARAPEEPPVECALLGVPATVAGCER